MPAESLTTVAVNGVQADLASPDVSVLIAAGTEDIVIPASNALKLVNRIPGAWLAQFPHGGHAFIAQYPRTLADLINSFLGLFGEYPHRVPNFVPMSKHV